MEFIVHLSVIYFFNKKSSLKNMFLGFIYYKDGIREIIDFF